MNQINRNVLLYIYRFDKDSPIYTGINKMYLAAH